MKALFFFPATGYYTRALSNPLGLLSIATFLKRRGHEVKIVDRNIEKVNLSRLLEAFRPDHERALHFGWGIQTGIVDVFGVDAFMGHNTMRLMRIFRQLLLHGAVRPFDGPLYDQQGGLRCEKQGTLSLLDVQTMDWYAEGIIETIQA